MTAALLAVVSLHGQYAVFNQSFDGELWGVRYELIAGGGAAPAGVAYVSGILFVADSNNRTVTAYDGAGQIVPKPGAQWNTADPASPVHGLVPHQLTAVVVNVDGADRNAILISDDASNRVAAFDTAGGYLFTLRLERPFTAATSSLSIGDLATSSGAKFNLTDSGQTLTLSGSFAAGWVEQHMTGQVESGALVFQGPATPFPLVSSEFLATPTAILRGTESDPVAPGPLRVFGVAYDTVGNLYALDAFTERLNVYGPDLSHLFTFGTPVADGTVAEFQEPWGMAFWPDATGTGGRLYINDTYNNRILIYRPVDGPDNGDTVDALQLESVIRNFVAPDPAIELFSIALDPSTGSLAVTDFATPRVVVLQQARLATFDFQVLDSSDGVVESVCTGTQYKVRFSLTVPAGLEAVTGVTPQLEIDGVPASAPAIPSATYPSSTVSAGQVVTYTYTLTAPDEAGHDIEVVAGATATNTADILIRSEAISLGDCAGETDPSTITASPSTPPQVSGWTPVFEGEPFSVTLAAQDDDGIVSIEYRLEGANETGNEPVSTTFDGVESDAVVVAPIPDFGRTTLRYRVRDGNMIWSGWQSLDLRPTLVVNRITNEGSGVDFRVGDPEGVGFTYSVSGLPAVVSFSPATGQFGGVISFNANNPYSTNPAIASGVYTVVVTETAAGGATSNVGFTWTINHINRAPIITTQTAGAPPINPGQLFSMQIEGSDPDNDPVRFTMSGRGVNTHQDLPQSITINAATGLISGIFPTDADTEYEIKVGLSECSVQTALPPCDGPPLPGERLATLFAFTLAEGDGNLPADLVNPGPQSSAEGAAVTLALQASDPDGDALTFAASGLPRGLSIDTDTGVIGGVVGFDAAGTYAVTVTANDHVSYPKCSVTFSWVITDTNRPPVIAAAPWTTLEGVTVNHFVIGTDPDQNPLTYTAIGLPPGVSMTTAGVFFGALDYNASGVYPVTVTVSDGTARASTTFSWTVADVNRAPIAVADVTSVVQGRSTSIAVRANDRDPDVPTTLTIVGVTTPTSGGAVINTSDGTVTYTAAPAFAGTATFSYTISDGSLTASALVTVTVLTGNVAPVCSAATGGEIWPPNHNKSYVAPIIGVFDPDGNAVTITVTGIWQDELLDSTGDGKFSPDGRIENGQAWVRAERHGHGNKAAGNGRVYEILFTAADAKGGTCTGSVFYAVPHDKGQRSTAIDSGVRYDSTGVIAGARDKKQIHKK